MSITVVIDSHVEELDDGTQISWPSASLTALPGDLILANSGSDLAYLPWNPVSDSRFAGGSLVFTSGVDWSPAATGGVPTVGASPYTCVTASGIDLTDEELAEVEEIGSIDPLLDIESGKYPITTHGTHGFIHGGQIYQGSVGRRHKHQSDPSRSNFACVFHTAGGSTSSASLSIQPFGGGVPYYLRDDGTIVGLTGGGSTVIVHDSGWPGTVTSGGVTSNGVQGAIICYNPDTNSWKALPFNQNVWTPGNLYGRVDYYTWIKVGNIGWQLDAGSSQLPFFSYFDGAGEIHALHLNSPLAASLIIAVNSLWKGAFPTAGLAASDIITSGTITAPLFAMLAPLVGPAENLWHPGAGPSVTQWHARLFNNVNFNYEGQLTGGGMTAFDSFGTNEQLEWRCWDGASNITTIASTVTAGDNHVYVTNAASLAAGQEVTVGYGAAGSEVLIVTSFNGTTNEVFINGTFANNHSVGASVVFSQWSPWRRLKVFKNNLDGVTVDTSHPPGLTNLPGGNGAHDMLTPVSQQRYYVYRCDLLSDATAILGYCYNSQDYTLDNAVQLRVTYTHHG